MTYSPFNMTPEELAALDARLFGSEPPNHKPSMAEYLDMLEVHRYGHKDASAKDDPRFLSFEWSPLMKGATELPPDLAEESKNLDIKIRFTPNDGYHVTMSDVGDNPILDALIRYYKEYFIYNPKIMSFLVRPDWDRDRSKP